MFVNMLPVRLRPEAGAGFGAALDACREAVVGALGRQDVPFERIVDALRLPRESGRHPLVDVSIDYHNIEHHELALDGLRAEPIALEPIAAGMDLVITCAERADGIDIDLDYAAELFERSTVDRLIARFEAIIDGACDDEERPLAELHRVDRRAAIRAKCAGAPFVAVHDRIAARAAQTPHATAVIGPDGASLSLARLDGLANAQAKRLVASGLRRGEQVALVAERTEALLIAQLAILKAGGAYLPLDPAHPRERHRRVLDEARPRFAFAPAGFDATAGIAHRFDLADCLVGEPTGFAGPAVDADDPIYVVYTSGSTGTPKGIEVKHRGIANLGRDHDRRGIFTPGDMIISLADPTFDIFAFESLLPLAAGAAVHLCPADDQKDAAAIAARLARHDVTHIQLPVSKMAALTGNRRFRAELPRLRVIVCGGEHFADTLLELLQRESTARIFNMYGPTETTVTATVKEFAPGDEVTIGASIDGAEVVIIDEQGRLLPDGEVGELCVLGEGVAAGYTNNPEQMAAAFRELPELPGLPAYRTSDAGLRRPDGEIELRGRLDHQVKFNGNRIELGEIERAAMRVEGIDYAVAAVIGDDLALFVTGGAATAALREAIAAALPAAILPTRIERVAKLPTLPNGKVDRKALPALLAAGGTAPAPAAEPALRADEALETILGVWAEVLGRPVCADDNFFEVGGNSYKLMLVNNRLGEALGRDIPLVRLFEHPSPRGLAAAIGAPAPATPVATAAPASEGISLDDLEGFAEWSAPAAPAAGRIAVIGMAGVLPGAATADEHLRRRFAGEVSIERFTREQLRDAGIDDATIDDPRYVNARGAVDADTFDAGFFGYSRREAETMDPQLRLLHETAWHALEDAGCVPGAGDDRIGIYAGSGTNFAWMAGLLRREADAIGLFEAMTMNEKDFLATKIAYKLDLTGPAVTVQTACSTSLVAIHEAVRALRDGDADLALAGGVALNFPRREGYEWHEGLIFSEDGVCRPFSDDADGTVGGQGCALVVLKPLERALADGDHIHAVIAGSATNNDGATKVGYTAPAVAGQERVIRAALADAGVAAESVGYVETHGTGTRLGDPIEYAALEAVYGRGERVLLGAAKANIGHLDAAAGVAGLIGAIGALQRTEAPPMANFAAPNAGLVPSSALRNPTARTPLAAPAAAVSSFGIGGTNAHIILEPAPARAEREPDTAGEHLLLLSAREPGSLERMRVRLAEHCTGPIELRDASYTLAHGRAEFEHRAVAVADCGDWSG